MNNIALSTKADKAIQESTVLVVSVRNIRHQAANCALYEFEDFICEMYDADLYCPESEFSGSRKLYRAAKYITGSNRFSQSVSFFPSRPLLDDHHELVLVVADNPWQLHLLNSLEGWREHGSKKICYISELWPKDLDNWRLLKEPFDDYDHVFVGLSTSVSLLKATIDVPCSYVPLGVNCDVLSPVAEIHERVIDLLYVGRRKPSFHRDLLGLAREKGLFYYYDSAKSQKLFVDNHTEHRFMYSQLLKRSKFAIAFPAKQDLNGSTQYPQEIGSRYYEFVASGAVVIGQAPDNEHFSELFGWENSVISLTKNSESLDIAKALAMEPDRIEEISRRNTSYSFKMHDWVYRWQIMLRKIGIPDNQRIKDRVARLRKSGDSIAI